MYITEINQDIKLIKYSSLIIEKYSEFYNEIDLDKLMILKHIIETIKQIDQEFKCVCNFDEKIHRSGLKLVKIGKIKKEKIIEILREDIYYIGIKYNKKIYRPLEILDGIDISLIKDKEIFQKMENYKFL